MTVDTSTGELALHKNASMDGSHLAQLPEELLQETLNFLDGRALLNLAQSSKWAYEKAIPLLWNDVELVDCRKRHFDEDVPYNTDDHDDSPIIRKLIVLAGNTWIASQVQSLTHRCHLPPPALFAELPQTNFQSRFLSHDPRTLALLERACANLTHLHTLRIIFGHWHITKGLLNGILDKSRRKVKPLRKLWLESCALTGLSARMLNDPDLGSLESLRLRRLQLLSDTGRVSKQQVYTRGRSTQYLQNGQGSLYTTTTDQWTRQEIVFGNAVHSWGTTSFAQAFDDWEKMFEGAHIYDDMIYDNVLQSLGGQLDGYRNDRWDHRDRVNHHIQKIYDFNDDDFPAAEADSDPFPAALSIFKAAASSLTSLNLDWIITRRVFDAVPRADAHKASTAFSEMFALRFPHLKAFQLRNSVVKECQLPSGLYLLDECSMQNVGDEVPRDLCISFMEAHPNLRCLAWPIDRFFNSANPGASERVAKIIDTLSQNLVELRADAMYDVRGEFQTDNADDGVRSMKSRNNRRTFISNFAARMRNVEYLKLEGGIPRDERRETIRAFGACPLKKVVLIGVNCPVGNTWGLRGQDIEFLGVNEDLSDPDDLETLEYEDLSAITHLGATKPSALTISQKFCAEYGWPPSAPLTHTIAAYHADTIQELKFCGYRGAPLLWDPTPVTFPMYSPLRLFHKLKSLVLSLWLQTFFEEDYRDEEIIAYWLNTRSPTSTALAVAPGTARTPNGWAKQLTERFAPSRIVQRMKAAIGPSLSERAKAQEGGVHVRGSFCVGMYGGIYDFDIHIGKAADGQDAVLSWTGPREELHPLRRREKLSRRRWF